MSIETFRSLPYPLNSVLQVPEGTGEPKLWKIIQRQKMNIPPYIHSSSVTAGTAETAFTEFDDSKNLKPNPSHIWQGLIGIEDAGIRLHIEHQSRQTLGSDRQTRQGYLTSKESPAFMPRYEVWWWYGATLWIKFTNYSPNTIRPRLRITGWIYAIKEIPEGSPLWSDVMANPENFRRVSNVIVPGQLGSVQNAGLFVKPVQKGVSPGFNTDYGQAMHPGKNPNNYASVSVTLTGVAAADVFNLWPDSANLTQQQLAVTKVSITNKEADTRTFTLTQKHDSKQLGVATLASNNTVMFEAASADKPLFIARETIQAAYSGAFVNGATVDITGYYIGG